MIYWLVLPMSLLIEEKLEVPPLAGQEKDDICHLSHF